MLVLVSFVLVLAAAVTLVVGLLQSGLALIYLSIACSVLAGVVLAVAVLRGRPEPRAAAAPRSFTPPRPAQVPASVGAPSAAAETTTSWSAPTSAPTPPPAPPPPPPSPSSGPSDDAATRAAGTALLGRLRRRQQDEPGDAAEPAPVPVPADDLEPETSDETMEIPVTPGGGYEGDDGFPVADYDRLRATELLSRLPELDRNQLEAVRDREAAGKNRFTIMSRIDALLAAQEAPAWEASEEEWEEAEDEGVVIEAGPVTGTDDFDSVLDEEEWEAAGEVEDDEVDELVSPAAGFPIAGYESLTVGQILPRLTELDADELAQVRAREQQGRNRGTILDRIDRLAARSGRGGATAMPPAPAARKAAARKTPARKAAAPAPKAAPAPAKKRGRAAAVPAVAPDVAPIPVPPATPAPAPKKAPARKKAAAAGKAAPARKAAPRAKKAAPVVPTETAAPAKKARAPRKATKKA